MMAPWPLGRARLAGAGNICMLLAPRVRLAYFSCTCLEGEAHRPCAREGPHSLLLDVQHWQVSVRKMLSLLCQTVMLQHCLPPWTQQSRDRWQIHVQCLSMFTT